MTVMEDIKEVLVYLLTPSASVFIAGSLIVFLVPILIHYLILRRTPYTSLPSILLAGPSGSGKTSLLTLLERGDQAAQTHTSQIPHVVELTGSRDRGATSFRVAAREDAPGTHIKFLLVDTPGHGKLRNYAMSRLRGDKILRGIVFVVDAAALDDALPSTAAYLYDLLLFLQKRAGTGSSSRPPQPVQVLIAANKLDLFTALPAALVKSNLEAELGRIRQSRSKGLLDSGVGVDEISSEDHDDWLGQYGSDKFAFPQMREFDIEVDVQSGSILEGNVDKWWNWIVDRL